MTCDGLVMVRCHFAPESLFIMKLFRVLKITDIIKIRRIKFYTTVSVFSLPDNIVMLPAVSNFKIRLNPLYRSTIKLLFE